MKKEEISNIQFTNEELFYIWIILGSSNCPNFTSVNSRTYDKLNNGLFNQYDNYLSLPTTDLNGNSKEIWNLYNEIFEEVEEMTLEEVCKQLGKNIKIVK